MRLLEIAQVPSEHVDDFKSGEHDFSRVPARDLR
jgi:hypothetical protein